MILNFLKRNSTDTPRAHTMVLSALIEWCTLFVWRSPNWHHSPLINTFEDSFGAFFNLSKNVTSQDFALTTYLSCTVLYKYCSQSVTSHNTIPSKICKQQQRYSCYYTIPYHTIPFKCHTALYHTLLHHILYHICCTLHCTVYCTVHCKLYGTGTCSTIFVIAFLR